MDAMIRKHQTLILSSLYMIFGLLVAGYSILYSTREDIIKMFGSSSTELRQHKEKLNEIKKKQTEDTEKAKQGIHSLPAFLARINEIANINHVVIRTLSPDNEQPFKFTLTMITDYFTFIRFTVDLESLDILLDDIQLHPYDLGQNPPQHAISFSLIPHNDASPLSDNIRLSELKEWVAQKDRRNPFQRLHYDTTRKQVRPVIDLTWIYKLGGLGDTPEGHRYATIERKDYKVGDKLDDRIITAIENDRVLLEKQTPEGKIIYSLESRRGETIKKK